VHLQRVHAGRGQAPAGGDVCERAEHEGPLGEARVRQRQHGVVEGHGRVGRATLAVGEQVDVQHPRAEALRRAIQRSAVRRLDALRSRQQRVRLQRRLHLRCV
jgi:hypothetical protein